jgi:hypothetical protein
MSIRPTPLYREFAKRINQLSNCITSGNTEWRQRAEDDIEQLVKQFMPSGSGIDCGTKIDIDACLRHDGEHLVFTLSFHHMNESGMYDGWTEHAVIVKPSLWHEFDLTVTGRDRNEIKEYLGDVYYHALMQLVYQDSEGEYHDAEQPAISGA